MPKLKTRKFVSKEAAKKLIMAELNDSDWSADTLNDLLSNFGRDERVNDEEDVR